MFIEGRTDFVRLFLCAQIREILSTFCNAVVFKKIYLSKTNGSGVIYVMNVHKLYSGSAN